VQFILAGLVDSKVLPGDGRKYTGAIMHSCFVDPKRPQVEATLS
jgi:hypothetical protein